MPTAFGRPSNIIFGHRRSTVRVHCKSLRKFKWFDQLFIYLFISLNAIECCALVLLLSISLCISVWFAWNCPRMGLLCSFVSFCYVHKVSCFDPPTAHAKLIETNTRNSKLHELCHFTSLQYNSKVMRCNSSYEIINLVVCLCSGPPLFQLRLF